MVIKILNMDNKQFKLHSTTIQEKIKLSHRNKKNLKLWLCFFDLANFMFEGDVFHD